MTKVFLQLLATVILSLSFSPMAQASSSEIMCVIGKFVAPNGVKFNGKGQAISKTDIAFTKEQFPSVQACSNRVAATETWVKVPIPYQTTGAVSTRLEVVACIDNKDGGAYRLSRTIQENANFVYTFTGDDFLPRGHRAIRQYCP